MGQVSGVQQSLAHPVGWEGAGRAGAGRGRSWAGKERDSLWTAVPQSWDRWDRWLLEP